MRVKKRVTFVFLSLPHIIFFIIFSGHVFANTTDKASNTAEGQASILITYIPSIDEEDKLAASHIKQSQSVETVLELSQHIIPFDPPVKIVFGAKDGPLYDPELHQIDIPYAFWRHATERFTSSISEKSYSKKDHDIVQVSSSDALLHTLLHELGHAYVAANDIPILGKEEDAVDNFATVILLNHVTNGDAIAMSAAELFALEDEQVDHFDNLDFIGEHSLDIQRYYYTLCLIYGSNPESYPRLLDDIDKPFKTEQEEICVEEFHRVSENWAAYLTDS